jgi:hypothetical protein
MRTSHLMSGFLFPVLLIAIAPAALRAACFPDVPKLSASQVANLPLTISTMSTSNVASYAIGTVGAKPGSTEWVGNLYQLFSDQRTSGGQPFDISKTTALEIQITPSSNTVSLPTLKRTFVGKCDETPRVVYGFDTVDSMFLIWVGKQFTVGSSIAHPKIPNGWNQIQNRTPMP